MSSSNLISVFDCSINGFLDFIILIATSQFSFLSIACTTCPNEPYRMSRRRERGRDTEKE